jgi:(2Fe-2S) ferredoxin
MSGCQAPGDLDDLRDTVKPYGRHVLALAGDEDLGPRIENMDGLLGTMADDVKTAWVEQDPGPKLTALRTEPRGDPYDLLVFPDEVRYEDVGDREWGLIREGHLKAGQVADALDPEPVEGFHVTACTHAARDDRCGSCGPLLVEAFREAAEARGYDDVTVHASSHVGGHRFAGNVLVYPGGVWYGYVQPGDVGTILEHHVDEGAIWPEKYRGEMVDEA